MLIFSFLDDAVTIGVEQLPQVFNLRAKFNTLVGISHQHAVGRHFHNLGGRLDVGTQVDGIASTSEGLVLYELEPSAVVLFFLPSLE